jgi:hypothetical protein
MSIFYPREKWHLLLHELNDIFKKVEVRKHTERVLVFFNQHRGENLRIVFEFNSDSRETTLQKISMLIKQFISDKKVVSSPVRLPVTGFFTDFPANKVYYNLFNEQVLRYGNAGTIQKHLSELIFNFFNNTRVDDKTLLSLAIYLHQYLLNVFFPDIQDRRAFIESIIKDQPAINPGNTRAVAREFNNTKINTILKRRSAARRLVAGLANASQKLLMETSNITLAYNAIAAIIQLHLFKIPDLPVLMTTYSAQFKIVPDTECIEK